jgi:hypothetical protein
LDYKAEFFKEMLKNSKKSCFFIKNKIILEKNN